MESRHNKTSLIDRSCDWCANATPRKNSPSWFPVELYTTPLCTPCRHSPSSFICPWPWTIRWAEKITYCLWSKISVVVLNRSKMRLLFWIGESIRKCIVNCESESWVYQIVLASIPSNQSVSRYIFNGENLILGTPQRSSLAKMHLALFWTLVCNVSEKMIECYLATPEAKNPPPIHLPI